MFTQQELDYLLEVLDRVVPTGPNKEVIRVNRAVLHSIRGKVAALPVTESPPPEPKSEPRKKS